MALITELTTTGYSRLKSTGILAPAITELMAIFYSFVKNPPIGPCSFDNPFQPIGSGFAAKNGQDGSDLKTFFHYQPQLMAQLAAHNPALLTNERLRRLLALCESISSACMALFLPWLYSLQQELPNRPALAQAVRRNPSSILRLVAYTGYRPTAPPRTLTGDHSDFTLGTLALYESHAGFEICPPNTHVWLPLEPNPAEPIVFGGQKLTQVTHGLIPALRHRARHLQSEERVNQEIIRGALVFFGYLSTKTTT